MKKATVCATCGKLKKAGMITAEGAGFCTMACKKNYKKKNVCEFC